MNNLLSEEFIVFSQKIALIYAEQKAKKEEMRKLYAEYQKQNQQLEETAAKLYAEFEGSQNKTVTAENCHCDHEGENNG